MEEDKRSLKDLAQEAYNIQDAVNTVGLVQSWAKSSRRLQSILGTNVNTHPITILWIDKLASLAGIQDLGWETVSRAYDWLREIGVEMAN